MNYEKYDITIKIDKNKDKKAKITIHTVINKGQHVIALHYSVHHLLTCLFVKVPIMELDKRAKLHLRFNTKCCTSTQYRANAFF